MNSFSIRLSNQALERALELARERGLDSLEKLVELLLLEDAGDRHHRRARKGNPPPAATPRVSTSPQLIRHGTEVASVDADFSANPPALGLERPVGPLTVGLAVELPPSALPLPFLTNRLNPLKASVRALANLAAREGQWPALRDFQAKAGHAARERGLQLQVDDRHAGRRGRTKRSIAWPVGANPSTALDRFAFAFTLTADRGTPTGPLATLGLAAMVGDRVALTEPGWDLANSTSPLLDGGAGTLSREEAAIFLDRLRQAEPERKAIDEFVRAVHHANGAQPRIDELLGTWHPDWSSDQAEAQRSAMMGRLGELGIVDVSGRGEKANVTLPGIEKWEDPRERSAA